MSIFVVVVAVGLLYWLAPVPVYATAESCPLEREIFLEIPIGSVLEVQGLTHYIAALYQFIISAIAILSAVMLMFNGMRWATAGGNAQMVGVAKGGVVNAIIGLLIALTSFLLLNVINPRLTNLADVCPTAIVVREQQTAGAALQECAGNGQDASCTQYEQCQSPNTCTCTDVNWRSYRVNSAPEYKCVPNNDNVTQGGDCFNDDNCQPPLKCIGATTDHAGTCQQSTQGESCETNADCGEGLQCLYATVVKNYKECYPSQDRPYEVECTNDEQCADNLTCNEGNNRDFCWYGDGTDQYRGCANDDDNCAQGFKCTQDPNQDPNTPSMSRAYICAPKVEGDSCDYSNMDCGPTGALSCVDTWGGNECYDGSTGDRCETGADCMSISCVSGNCT